MTFGTNQTYQSGYHLTNHRLCWLHFWTVAILFGVIENNCLFLFHKFKASPLTASITKPLLSTSPLFASILRYFVVFLILKYYSPLVSFSELFSKNLTLILHVYIFHWDLRISMIFLYWFFPISPLYLRGSHFTSSLFRQFESYS